LKAPQVEKGNTNQNINNLQSLSQITEFAVFD